ncbi:MAG: hypothetical protein NT127_05700, partial [Sphingobacteriales bacterium]|nr:hypothetical protein [Sphingobacteriales bacterium]
LASFDSERTGDGVYVFHVYYRTIRQIADNQLSIVDNTILYSFSDTILHELIHAADLATLQETNNIREQSFRLHGGNQNHLLKDLNAPNYEWNVQWTLLHFFQIFRNEGIAMMGEHLLDEHPNLKTDRPIDKVMIRFKENLNQVFKICNGLKYYSSIEPTEAHQILRALSMEAYQYGDLIFLELIKTLHPEENLRIEKVINYLSQGASNTIDHQEVKYFLKQAMQVDLSEYVQAIFNNEILNRDEPLSKQQLLECCAVIQNDAQHEVISTFSKNIATCAFNKNSQMFIETIREVIGSKMSVAEITEGYKTFLQKNYPEDIVQRIQHKADELFSLATNENNEVALWVLTYLLDDQDLIHDELSVLGWQDDWMVVEGAWRIINN